jgi:imidazolonepropionase-like amidohydrolase
MDKLRKDDLKIIDASGLSLLPGFIDCHLHITGFSQGYPPSLWLLENTEERLIRSVRQIRELLMAGFTTVVDNSRNGSVLKSMVLKGEILGPMIVPCGRGLAASGGAGFIPNINDEKIHQTHPWAITCDGVDQLVKTVRNLRNDGAEFIKIWVSGAGMHDHDEETDVQYSQCEINSVVDEAHRHGLKVKAHCTCALAASMAIEANVDCIIHGENLDKTSKELFFKSDIVWLPTLSLMQAFGNPKALKKNEIPSMSAKYEAAISAHYEKAIPAHCETVFEFYNKKHPIALGSDTFADDRTPYGINGLREIKEFIQIGLKPIEAIKIATYNGAKLLGMENKIGTLKEGAIADLILMKGRPDKDASLFDDVRNIVLVIRAGKIVKDSMDLLG